MSRPGFAHGLGPTPWELFVFLLWLGVVILSMTAMVAFPAFHLLFWPTLWIYDLRHQIRPRISMAFFRIDRLRPGRGRDVLWDRELDG